jgi:GGDEF domain-containing protein
VKDRRTTLIALGVVGLVLGLASLLTSSGLLGLFAGLAALVASALAVASPNRVNVAGVVLPDTAPTAPPVREVAVTADPSPAASSEPSLTDPETGLYSEEFFRVAVETRVLAARRHLRPVAVVLFEVIDGLGPGASNQADPVAVSQAIRQTLREADTACRLNDGRYGFVLEDTPEDGAIWTVERLRRRLSEFQPEQTRWAGVACYPAHAFGAAEVMAKAELAFDAAREWAQDRIEVAVSE